jgi:hypothetical protein
LATSLLYPQQAFRLGRNAYGFQFHFEITEQIIRAWMELWHKDMQSEGVTREDILPLLKEHLPLLNRRGEEIVRAFAALVHASPLQVLPPSEPAEAPQAAASPAAGKDLVPAGIPPRPASPASTEKRREVRTPFTERLRVVKPAIQHATAANLSALGICITVPKPIAEGAQVELELFGGSIFVKGTVRKAASDRQGHRLGIEFLQAQPQVLTRAGTSLAPAPARQAAKPPALPLRKRA